MSKFELLVRDLRKNTLDQREYAHVDCKGPALRWLDLYPLFQIQWLFDDAEHFLQPLPLILLDLKRAMEPSYLERLYL